MNPFFQVEMQSVRGVNSKVNDGFKAVVRKDTGDVLGVHSARYALIPNEEAVKFFEASLEESRIAPLAHKDYVLNEGARFFRRYDLGDKFSLQVAPGDVLKTQVVLSNSYDGSSALGFELFFIRLICTNGMTVSERLGSQRIRHLGQWSVKATGEDVVQLIEGANSVVQGASRMLAAQVGAEEVRGILSDPGLPVHLRRDMAQQVSNRYDMTPDPWIEGRWVFNEESTVAEKPLSSGREALTQWALYNMMTAYITHKMEVDFQKRLAALRQSASHFGL